MTTPAPSQIRLSPTKDALKVVFGAQSYTFTAEFLRITSPSAEVQGHGPGQLKIIGGKKNITITAVEPVGHYAVRLTFSDQHNTGLYTWSYFQNMGEQQFDVWEDYTQKLKEKGLSRIQKSEAQ